MASGPLDTHAARELELYVENDSTLHRQQEQPIQKNLITKMARGVYNHSGAVKLYGYLMESGAKKYAKEFGSQGYGRTGGDWHQIFSPATRKHAAETFAKSFEVEAKLGNYDHMLPKKYSGWSGKTGTKTNPGRSTTRRNNGRSYVTKGVSIGIPRYSFDPKTGDKFYVEGKLITIKRVDGEGMLHFSPSVDGTFAMSAGNLYQMARVPEDSRFAPYEYRIKRVPNGRLVPARIRHKGHTYSGKVKRVNGRVKIFVTHEVARKINPHQHTGLKIVPVTKERSTRQVRPLLRAPYNLMPFALYKRTIGKGMYMLFRGTEFLKAGTKSQLKKWAKPAPSGHRVGTPYI